MFKLLKAFHEINKHIITNGNVANGLLKQASKSMMFSSYKAGLPYGYGIFSQEVQGMKLVWAYGQYEDRSITNRTVLLLL